MELDALTGGAEIVGGAAVFLMLVFRQVRTGARDAWRGEAEAQAARSARLSEDLANLLGEVKALRLENVGLRTEIAALRSENRELREHIDNLLAKEPNA